MFFGDVHMRAPRREFLGKPMSILHGFKFCLRKPTKRLANLPTPNGEARPTPRVIWSILHHSTPSAKLLCYLFAAWFDRRGWRQQKCHRKRVRQTTLWHVPGCEVMGWDARLRGESG